MAPQLKDVSTIEREKRETIEFLKDAPQMPYGDERDRGNPRMVEKYGDQLPMRWGERSWPPWELWMDTIGMLNTWIVYN
jgi:hypothetical protein